MDLTSTDLERIAAWCDTSGEVATERRTALSAFFGTGDDQPANYMPGAGDLASRHRRFLGWFMFNATLADGTHPSARAAHALFRGEQRVAALRALTNTRYVMAVVSDIMPSRGVMLELEDERFEVRNRAWARTFRPDTAVHAHLVPVRPNIWLPGPGWLQWPVAIGPNMRRELSHHQIDPIEAERTLQGRHRRTDNPPPPRDATLADAVRRMTEAALSAGRPGLVRSEEEWRALVLRHIQAPDISAFAQQVVTWADDARDIAALNRWIGLAQNIWNATPQPDRDGRTAHEQGSAHRPAISGTEET